MTDPNLIRFLDAQDQIFNQVIDELTHGRKQTHWMWFIFPEAAGLGRSAMARHYAIRSGQALSSGFNFGGPVAPSGKTNARPP